MSMSVFILLLIGLGAALFLVLKIRKSFKKADCGSCCESCNKTCKK